jgi:enoyl-CoA hydratase/carnithine racemase
METTGHISFRIEENLGIIRIDNPPANYLIKPEFIPAAMLQNWIEKNLLKGILVCGSGKHFSGGADLDRLFAMSQDDRLMESEISKGKALLRYIENLDIPVVAAIQGICFGGGLEIALACHIRVCSTNALFAFPETNQGFIPGLGGINAVSELASVPEALKFVLSGDMINAEEAKMMKIVDYIVPGENLIHWSLNMLKKMTGDRRLKVINYVMKALHNTKTMSIEESIREETRMFCELAKEEMERRQSDLKI